MATTDGPAMSPLDLNSNSVDEIHSRTRPVPTRSFSRTWLASSADLRSTADTNDVHWGIHWFTPASAILLFTLGTLSAITHHLHYNALHNTKVGTESHQRWALWIGSGLSFFTKVTLTAALGISRTQWVWLTLRKKWLTLRGIDAIFGVTSDPTYFINMLMLKRAKAATIIAISMWMIPIAAILTPGTLSVHRFPDTQDYPCSVGSLRFPFDYNSTAILQPEGGLAPNLPVIPMAQWYEDIYPDTAGATAGTLTHHAVLRRLIVSAYTGSIARPIPLPPAGTPSVTTVGEKCGDNCTYTVEFVGPSVTCTPFTSWSTVTWYNWTDESHFMLGRHGYGDPREFFSDAPEDTSDPILLGLMSLEEPISPIVFQCRSSIARYTVEQVVMERSFLEPNITKVEPITLAGFPPTSNPADETYFGQTVLMQGLARVLCGAIKEGIPTTTDIGLTPLAEQMIENPMDVVTAVETMGHKMIVSLVASAFQLNGSAYALDVTATQDTVCTTTKYNLLYIYSARTLILVYALAVACALVTTVAGFFALRQNGMASTQTPSSIIRTTRNCTFDESIVGKYTLGGNTMSDELEKMELRFGALRADETGTTHYALGVRGEISPIKRY